MRTHYCSLFDFPHLFLHAHLWSNPPTLFASSPSFSSHLAATLVDITRHTRTTYIQVLQGFSRSIWSRRWTSVSTSALPTLVRASIEVTMAAAR